MTPSPTSNPDLGELVARLRELLEKADKGPWVLHVSTDPTASPSTNPLTDSTAARSAFGRLCVEAVNSLPTLLDALAASEARADKFEQLHKNRCERLVEVIRQWRFTSQCLEMWQKRATKAEAEVAGLKADLVRQREVYAVAAGEVQNQRIELSSLRARVAEVLEPFAKAAKSSSVSEGRQGDAWSITLNYRVTFMDFRRAAELHAAVSGEGK